MRRSFTILLLITLLPNICVAQFKRQLDSFKIISDNSKSDSDKVIILGKIANLYYTYKFEKEADSVLREQLLLAELSDNSNLLLIALFGEAITNISNSTNSESFDKTVQFIQKGINYAKSVGGNEYIALGYSRMANLLRKRGQYDNALSNAQLSLGYLPLIKSDSIKAALYIELGETFQDKGQSVSACTNYNNAFDIALKIKSIPLQSTIHHCFSEMYKGLGQFDAAKEELKTSLKIDKANNYGEGMVRDYYDLARLTDEKFYIEKALELAKSLSLTKYIFKTKVLMLAYLEVIEKDSNKALKFLENEPDLKQSYLNVGVAYYNRAIGDIYLNSLKPDSALKYFKLVEYDYVNNFDKKFTCSLFRDIAQAYQEMKDVPNAISYYTKVLELSQKINDANSIASSAGELSDLYDQTNNYKEAFKYSKISITYKDSLRNLSKERDIALLGVEREKRKHEQELQEEERRLNNRQNIQYLAISIAICVVFVCFLFIGMFPISKLTIKLFGYFFFISLFEFIVLLIDNTLLAKAVHGEPLKLWLIKIVLIALLVPAQHFLEHTLIKFLESRKLLEARTKFKLKKWFVKTKKPALVKEADFEEDTAVL